MEIIGHSENTPQTLTEIITAMIKDQCLANVEGALREAAAHYNLDASECVDVGMRPLQSADFSVLAEKITKTKKPRAKRARKEVAAEERCNARVWRQDKQDGTSQCLSRCQSGHKYCKRHQKKFDQCSKPLQWDEQGRKIGLFLGDINDPIPMVDEDNKIRAEWPKNEECKSLIREKLASGEWEYHSNYKYGAKKKKTRKPKAPKKTKTSVLDEEVAVEMSENPASSDEIQMPIEVATTEKPKRRKFSRKLKKSSKKQSDSKDEEARLKAEAEKARLEEEAQINQEVDEIFEEDPESAQYNAETDSEEDDRPEVEEMEYNGQTYLVDDEGKVYDPETEDEIGTWDSENDKPIFNS